MAHKLQINIAEPGKPDDWCDVTIGDKPLSYAREVDAMRMLNTLSDDHGGRCRSVEYESDDEKKRREERAAAAKADTAKPSAPKRKTGARRRS